MPHSVSLVLQGSLGWQNSKFQSNIIITTCFDVLASASFHKCMYLLNYEVERLGGLYVNVQYQYQSVHTETI